MVIILTGKRVLGGVSQGPVLDPLLFEIYISLSDIDDGINSN